MKRFVVVAVIVVLFATAVFGTLKIRTMLAARIRHDLNADMAWVNVDGPTDKTTRAYRLYPLSYPALERWSLGSDYGRRHYAVTTIVHFGGPLARHWLDVAIDANPTDAYQILPSSGDPNATAAASAFGLGDPVARRRLAERAVRHLGEHRDGGAFDSELLRSLAPESLAPLEAWAASASPDRLYALYEGLPAQLSTFAPDVTARYKRLADLAKAPSEKKVAAQTVAPARMSRVDAAVLALNSGDMRALGVLRNVVDGDLHQLHDLGYGPSLLAVANAFPNSRFTRGCLAYDALRGDGTYFADGDGSVGDSIETGRIAPPASWQAWLAAYPDHPGADDASYWLGRARQRAGDDVGAALTYAQTLERGVGDRDMVDALKTRLLFMLDEGLDEAELASFERRLVHSRFVPLVRYAAAVRRARDNDFRGALAGSDELDLAASVKALSDLHAFYPDSDLDSKYRNQRARWRELAQLVPRVTTATPDALDRLASAWSGDDGWQIGYLDLFTYGERQGGHVLAGDPAFATPALRRAAQLANQNAQTIALAVALTARTFPADLVKRNRRRIIVALYEQQVAFPNDETYLMGDLPSLSARVGSDVSLFAGYPKPTTSGDARFDAYEARGRDIDAWWARQTVALAQSYAADYPRDEFAASALLSAYEVTGEIALLREIVARYPDGSRTEEARALLWAAEGG